MDPLTPDRIGMSHSREQTPTSTSSSFTHGGMEEGSSASIGGTSSQSQGLEDMDKFRKRMELEQVSTAGRPPGRYPMRHP